MRPAAAADGYKTLSWVIEATMSQVALVACVWCAQSSAPRITYHPRSSAHPWTLVVMPVQQLTLKAACKWVAHMSTDARRLADDGTKLLERSGRLGHHRTATLTFGTCCFDEPVGPVRGSSDGSCPRISGTTTTSRTQNVIANEELIFAASEGVWQLVVDFRSPPSHQVCHRSQSMHWSALAGDCTHMLTATDGPAASGSTGERTREDVPLAAARRAATQPRRLRRSWAPSHRARARRAAAREPRESRGRLGTGRGWLICARQPRWGWLEHQVPVGSALLVAGTSLSASLVMWAISKKIEVVRDHISGPLSSTVVILGSLDTPNWCFITWYGRLVA